MLKNVAYKLQTAPSYQNSSSKMYNKKKWTLIMSYARVYNLLRKYASKVTTNSSSIHPSDNWGQSRNTNWSRSCKTKAPSNYASAKSDICEVSSPPGCKTTQTCTAQPRNPSTVIHFCMMSKSEKYHCMNTQIWICRLTTIFNYT